MTNKKGGVEWLQKLKNVCSGDRLVKIAVAIGFVGIALIFFSQIFSTNRTELINPQKDSTPDLQTPDALAYADAYRQDAEKRLEDLLRNLKGVGEVQVFLTVSCTEESVYVQERQVNQSQDATGDQSKQSYSSTNKFVILENGGKALLSKVLTPKVGGAVILCDGGDSALVAESVAGAVSRALDISMGKIFVAPMKSNLVSTTTP